MYKTDIYQMQIYRSTRKIVVIAECLDLLAMIDCWSVG